MADHEYSAGHSTPSERPRTASARARDNRDEEDFTTHGDTGPGDGQIARTSLISRRVTSHANGHGRRRHRLRTLVIPEDPGDTDHLPLRFANVMMELWAFRDELTEHLGHAPPLGDQQRLEMLWAQAEPDLAADVLAGVVRRLERVCAALRSQKLGELDLPEARVTAPSPHDLH